MAELNLPNIREGGNIRFRIGLEDGGVAVDWSGLEDIRVFLYADAQKQVSGKCTIEVDAEDNTVLACLYSGDDVQFRGINSVLVRAKYMGDIKVYDKPAINIVARTSEADGVIVVDDPVVPVQISVEDVSTSLLNNAIDAAIRAAADAEAAAHLVPLQVLEDCVEATGKALEAASKAPYIDETTGNWFVWDAEAGEYVDSGKTARGATGNGIASWSVVESAEDAGNNVVTVTFTDGTSESFNVKNGHTGNGIASIVQTVESPDDAGTNVITITMTNGTVVTFNVKNGSKGTPGVAQAAYKSVSSLPTASAQTMDKIYLTPSGTSGVYNMSYTEFDGSAYSWQDLGTTAIQLSDYATKAELDQLEAKVDDLQTGKYYGYFAQEEDLPETGVDGFAYVGQNSPYTIYNLRDGVWTSSNITVNQSPIGNDEDIDQNEDGKLQFANRVYNAQQPNGMGYKILRKDATFASQVTDTNTIYEIRYLFASVGTVSIPNNCILLFNGGMLTGGTITLGVGTKIAAEKVKIFDTVTLNGADVVFAEWFGVSTASADNSAALVAAASGDTRRAIVFSPGVFIFTSSVVLPFCSLVGQKNNYATDTSSSNSTVLKYTGAGDFISIEDTAGRNRGVFVKDIAIRTECPETGNAIIDYTNYGKTGFAYKSGNGGVYFENVLIHGFETGLRLSNILHSKFDQCLFYYNGVGVSFEHLTLISTSTRFLDCYFHANGTNFSSGPNSLIDVHFSGCIFESSKVDNIVLHPLGLEIASFDNCYCERCNSLSTAAKTYIIRLVDEDGNGNKLTGEYHPVIQTHGCRWFGNTNANPYFLYLPVGQFYTEGDAFVTFTKLVSIDDLRTENSANSCGVVFLSYYRYFVNVIDEIDISAVSKNKLHITANSDNYGDQNILSRKTKINGIVIEECPDYSGARREIAVDNGNNNTVQSVCVTDDAIVVIGDKNRRLGEKYDSGNNRGFSNGVSLEVQTTYNTRPHGAKGNQIFVRGLKVGGLPFIGMSGTDQTGDSVAQTNWTNRILLQNLYGSSNPSLSQVSALTGTIFFNTSETRPIWWTSSKYVDALGNLYNAAKSGTTAQRPSDVKDGFVYLDTDLGKPIWAFNGGWVDATGATV